MYIMDDIPIWAQELVTQNIEIRDSINGINLRLDGMQGSIDGLRTLLNSTCDRVSVLERK